MVRRSRAWMDRADQQRVEQFPGKWLGSESNEQANYQGFFLDLCGASGIEGPPPKRSIAGDSSRRAAKWPTKPKEQLATIRDLLRTTPGEWSAKQIAAQFKGRITKDKLDAITENLQSLEWFGLVICDQASGNWHYAESAQAA